MKLLIDWEQFQRQINTLIEEGEALVQNVNAARDLDGLNTLDEKDEDWYRRCIAFLKSSFDDASYVESFRNEGTNNFHFPGKEKDLRMRKNEITRVLTPRLGVLKYYPRLLSISDAVVRPDEIDLEERKSYTTDEKLELIMDKLYELYDYEGYHSIQAILSGNGVSLGRYDEDKELVRALENYGYAEPLFGMGANVSAKLTLDGRRYVEQKRKKHTPDYSRIDNSVDELNAKLEEILDYVQSQGEMQQAIAEELDDLKVLFGSLSKKNLGQLLKGKLVDLMFGQVINPKTANFIFETFTQDILKLKW